jgi:hypothetical protein
MRTNFVTWQLVCATMVLLAGVGCSRNKPIVLVQNDLRDAKLELPSELFKRNQPCIRDIFPWNGQIIISADKHYVLDIGKATVAPLVSLDSKTVFGLATVGKDQPLALCLADDKLVLLAREGAEWRLQLLPEAANKPSNKFFLRADAQSIVLINDKTCFRKTNGEWKETTFGERPRLVGITTGRPSHYLLDGPTVYEGYDHGEWGGALLSLDLTTGEWTKVGSRDFRDLPVRDIKVDPKGNAWLVEGLAHLGTSEGVIHRRVGDVWKTFAECSRNGRCVDWNLPGSSLDGIAFDKSGRIYVLAKDLGVVNLVGTRWRQLTPGWPPDQYVAALHVTNDDLIIIGMLDAGVLLLNRKENKIRRVNLQDPQAGDERGPGAGASNRVRIR